MTTKSQKQVEIQLTRVLSMFFIVVCHIVDEYDFIPGHTILPQVFNVGVYTFFILSGFLYGRKNIDKFFSWFVKRIRKILFPAMILTVATIIVLGVLFNDKYSFLTYAIHLFCLQGVEFLWGGYHIFDSIAPLGGLWFVTIIMLCYLLTPVFQKFRRYIKNNTCVWIIIFLSILIRYILLIVVNFEIIYFIAYFMGYMISSINPKLETKNSSFVLFALLTFIGQAIRIFLQFNYDGSFLYSSYANISHLILGFFVFYTCVMFCRKFPKLSNQLEKSRMLSFFDEYSFYIYLTHTLFCTSVYLLNYSLLTNTILFILLVTVSTALLKFSVIGIDKLLQRIKQLINGQTYIKNP